jgi:hypothetical protein
MRIFIISLILLTALSPVLAYTPEQQITLDGTRLSFQLGAAYGPAQQGQNIAGFNALVDQWNAWVRANFGEDAKLLMQRMAGPINLQRPVLIANNTTGGGIVHQIDGKAAGPSYRTNDMNLLPESVINTSEFRAGGGGDYLGGI